MYDKVIRNLIVNFNSVTRLLYNLFSSNFHVFGTKLKLRSLALYWYIDVRVCETVIYNILQLFTKILNFFIFFTIFAFCKIP